MPFQDPHSPIRWSLHLSSAPARLYRMLATDEGRAKFWAESAVEREGHIHFRFPNGQTWRGEILAQQPPHLFRVVYFGGSVVTFTLADDGATGTLLTLTDKGVSDTYRCEVIAGWVSVLMALKAAADFGVDLRNHHPHRTWEQGFVDN